MPLSNLTWSHTTLWSKDARWTMTRTWVCSWLRTLRVGMIWLWMLLRIIRWLICLWGWIIWIRRKTYLMIWIIRVQTWNQIHLHTLHWWKASRRMSKDYLKSEQSNNALVKCRTWSHAKWRLTMCCSTVWLMYASITRTWTGQLMHTTGWFKRRFSLRLLPLVFSLKAMAWMVRLTKHSKSSKSNWSITNWVLTR